MTQRSFHVARAGMAVVLMGALSGCASQRAEPAPVAQETGTPSSALNVAAAVAPEAAALAPSSADASTDQPLSAPAAEHASAARDQPAAARTANARSIPRPRCARGERFGCRAESHGALRARTPFDRADSQVCGCVPSCSAEAPALLVRATGRHYADGSAEGTFRCAATGYPSAVAPAPTPLD